MSNRAFPIPGSDLSGDDARRLASNVLNELPRAVRSALADVHIHLAGDAADLEEREYHEQLAALLTPPPNAPSASSLLTDLASKAEAIISGSANPAAVMHQLLQAAEEAGIHRETWTIRRAAPDVFCADLFEDNPSAYEWMQEMISLHGFRPAEIVCKSSLLDALARPR